MAIVKSITTPAGLRPSLLNKNAAIILLSGSRQVHSSARRKSASLQTTLHPQEIATTLKPTAKVPSPSALSVLPLQHVLRSYVITAATSSPVLFNASLAVLKRMLNPNARFLSPERNPVLNWLFKKTFYAQFCSGEHKKEVQATIKSLRDAGYTGVILEYPVEVFGGANFTAESTAKEIANWRQGSLDTIDMASPGEFVALKWSGLGSEALARLDAGQAPTEAMQAAITEVCELAISKGVSLLPCAELAVTNVGIDAWTLDLQRKYNKNVPVGGKPMMYTTYQCYLKASPANLAHDLAVAQEEGFTLGVKLVRGAYMEAEPKGTVCDSKADTDAQYDAMTESVLRRQYNSVVAPASGASSQFPDVALVIASHNDVSVKKASTIRTEQALAGQPRIDCAYAQLQGMADEISCELVATSKAKTAELLENQRTAQLTGTKHTIAEPTVDIPHTYKYFPWGTVPQCIHFLYRRACENKDAASRTAETRKAMGAELVRRMKAAAGVW